MLLPWLILIPFIGGVLCLGSEFLGVKISRWIALFSMTLIFAFSANFWFLHENISHEIYSAKNLEWWLQFISTWIPRFGISIHLAVDALSLLMITMTGLLGIFSVLCSWQEISKNQGYFYFFLMWLLGSTIGIFLTIDMFLFFFFWEMMLIPMYFLISLWGSQSYSRKVRVLTAIKFLIYSQSSSVLMLLSILTLAFIHYTNSGIFTFDYDSLLKTHMSYKMEYLLMLGFFIPFAVKLPIVPFHGWLSDVHSQTPINGSIDIAGFLLKTAIYGLLRISITLFPNASVKFASIAMWLGIISIYYGSFLAFAQHNLKRLIAYASISHMGLILIAIYTKNQISYYGIIIQIISHSLSSSGLFILSGFLYKRLHTHDLSVIGDLYNKIKWFPIIFLFFVTSNLGIPGTGMGNFIGKIMILIGNFQISPLITFISTFGTIFISIYSLKMLHSRYFYKLNNYADIQRLTDMSLFELCITFSLIILLVVTGFYPQPILNTSCFINKDIYQYFFKIYYFLN